MCLVFSDGKTCCFSPFTSTSVFFSSQLANTGGPWLVILHEQHECRTCNLWEFVKEFVKFKTSIVSIYEY